MEREIGGKQMFYETLFYGKGNKKSAMVYAPLDMIDDLAQKQIRELVDNPALSEANLAFMPDTHGGKGATIGTTIKFNDLEEMKVNPEWVGNDIACSVAVFRLGRKEDINLDLDKMDELAQELHKPVGHEKAKKWLNERLYTEVFSKNLYKKALANLGRISGGNHFMEIGEMDGTYYLTIHNGSLFLGAQVYKEFVGRMESNKVDTKAIIKSLKEQGCPQMIQPVLEAIGEQERVNKEERRYLKTDDLEDYLEAMEVCNDYAFVNQLAVADRVFETLDIPGTVLGLLTERALFDGKDAFRRTKHNYVDKDNFTVYKGAASAQEGEDVLIPINMRDGLIVAKGKGNKGWNEAAPHGAGRLLSRTKAKQNIELGTYLEQMKDVRSISINEKTLDEAPDAYKSMDYILEQIQDTAEVVGVIKPVYNFKVAEDEPYWMRKKREK